MRKTLTALTLAGAVAATATVAAPAQAANPYTASGVCGAGYRVIDSHRILGPKGGWLGTAYLTYSAATKKNCSVTIKQRAVGTKTYVETSLARTGGNYLARDGLFAYYAGPLYVKAPGTCVIFGGRMRDAQGNGGSWITPRPVHCG